jgi:membrane peptidoglycan carboxypeptidase
MIVTTGAAAGAGLYFYGHLPSTDHFKLRYGFQNARIFDSRGDLLYNMADLSRQRGRRIVEPLQSLGDTSSACSGGVNRIPLLLQNATIATEDATFYKNPGFDPLSILRAAYQDITYGHIVSGASTITQQVVRANFFTPSDRSLTRKAQEVALAYEISRRYSKRKILWYYLNSVSYGNQAIGAQAATSIYFGKPVCSLDLAKSALLAGLPRGPSLYNPILYRSAALTRMRQVLRLMRVHGYLSSSAEARAAMREAATWHFSPPSTRVRYPQFVRYVIDQLNATPQLRARLYRGIDVYTTLDPRLQDLAQATVTKQIDGLKDKHVTDGALVSLDLRKRHYGWILAMVGSAHYRGQAGQINMTITPRQPGSSMKPFNYIWAFTHGNVNPATQVTDSPIILPDPSDKQNHGWYLPQNYDHQFHGTLTLRQALANSLNVPAVKVEFYVTGAQHVAQTARAFGMTHLYSDNPGVGCKVCYSVTLGGLARGTRLLEETSAYGVFGSAGSTVPPVAVWKIVKRNSGKVLFCSSDCGTRRTNPSWLVNPPRQVVDAAHAFEMTSVLSDNNARCTVQVCEFGLNSPLVLSRPAAAKTGTTNDWTDNWTVGYVPQIVTGVWTGNADRSAMQNVIGITGAAPIWQTFMEGAFKILRLPVQPFVQPPGVQVSGLCTSPGSSFTSTNLEDLVVGGATTARYPLCRIPETTSMPIPCSKYPANPPPAGFECPTGYYYGSTLTGTPTVQLYGTRGYIPPAGSTPLGPSQGPASSPPGVPPQPVATSPAFISPGQP